MLEEDAVSATECGLAVAPRVPGEAHSRSRVEEVPFHTAHRHSRCDAALDNSIRQPVDEQVADAAIRIYRGDTWLIVRWVKVEGLLLLLPISSKQAHPQSKIQREVVGGVPVILEVRFQNLIAVVVFETPVLLPVARDLSEQQVGKSIPG